MKIAEKLVLGLLILLVLYATGLGYYSYALNCDIERLGERFSALEAEQSSRLDALDAGLADLQSETLSRLNALEEKIEESLTTIGSIQGDISGITDNITDIFSSLGVLGGRITGVEDQTASVMNPMAVFAQVSAATVRISNGEYTLGSGVVMDMDRHVITAQHVIDGMSEIYVVTYDGLVSTASLVGECSFSDIAVLKLDKDPGVSPPPFADSSLIVSGVPVVAIGSPWFEIDDENKMRDTLTAGIISQVNRNVKIDGKWIPNLLQFDAPVNFGNSGGPLYNAGGEIAGIVIARVLPTEGDGIYFAVSANKAQRVADEIIANGVFDHPWLGVIIEELLPEEVYELGLETSNGVHVTGLISGSPAEAAGLTAGDIIISVNGAAMRNIADITSYLAEYTYPGETAVLEVMRDDVIELIPVEIGSREQ